MNIVLKKINNWHENNKHQEIIDFITSLPKEELVPELISDLGRAYNNLYWTFPEGEKDDTCLHLAEEVLKSIEEECRQDSIWNYRIAYTYFYLNNSEKAEFHFKEASRLGDEDYEDYLKAIDIAKEENITLENALYKVYEEQEVMCPQYLYTSEEMDALEEFIENNYGEIDSVFHELVSPDIHCDIYVIKPTEERNYYTLITGGMGAYLMNVPEEYQMDRRAELMINLPPNWQVKNQDEEWYWPIRWLKTLARLPID